MVMRPLTRNWRTQPKWTDGRPTAAVVGEIIQPNDRLTSIERIEIYNRQYWFRTIDCLHEDYPGLRAVLGQTRFGEVIAAYLSENPSRSFSLRNLGDRLPIFVEKHRKLAGPRWRMALDMARFEWAQVVAFDGLALPPIAVDDLLGVEPQKIRLRLQPYITLLELNYPLDDFTIALKKQQRALRSEASNAMEGESAPSSPEKKITMPKAHRTFLAVHRHENDLYFKRLEPAAYRLLRALEAGKSLAAACTAADSLEHIRKWFEVWGALGWFCKRERTRR